LKLRVFALNSNGSWKCRIISANKTKMPIKLKDYKEVSLS
jgi:hypothetical protein